MQRGHGGFICDQLGRRLDRSEVASRENQDVSIAVCSRKTGRTRCGVIPRGREIFPIHRSAEFTFGSGTATGGHSFVGSTDRGGKRDGLDQGASGSVFVQENCRGVAREGHASVANSIDHEVALGKSCRCLYHWQTMINCTEK